MPINITNKEVLDKMSELVITRYNAWRRTDERTRAEDEWEARSKAYLCEWTDKEKANIKLNRARAYLPLSQETADTIHGSIMSALFPPTGSYLLVRPIAMDDGTVASPEDVAKVQEFFEEYLRAMDVKDYVSAFIKTLVITGNACLSFGWKKIERTFVVGGKQRTITIYDAPELVNIRPQDVYFAPDKATPDDFHIRRMFRTIEELKSMTDVYDLGNIENLLSIAYVPDELLKTGAGLEQDFNVTLLKARGDFHIDDTVYEDYIVTVAIGGKGDTNPSMGHVIQAEPDQEGQRVYWGTYQKVPNTYIGQGALSPIKGIQFLMNVFTCQKADLISLILNGAFKYVSDGIFDPSQFQGLSAGQLVEVGNLNNLASIAPQADMSVAFTELSWLRNEAQLSTAINEFLMGSTARVQGRRTATEANLISQGATGRVAGVLSHLVNSVLEPYLSDLLTILLMTKYDGDASDFAYRAEFTGFQTSVLKQQELANLTTFLQLLKNIPGQTPNIQSVVSRFLYLLNVEEDILGQGGQEASQGVPLLGANQQPAGNAEQVPPQEATGQPEFGGTAQPAGGTPGTGLY